MSGCLGALAAALVDGELDHAGRERAHRHLAHCPACRAEVDAQRRLKAALGALPPAPAPDTLAARLLALQVPGTDRVPVGTAPVRPVTVRSATGPGHARPRGRRLRRRTTVSSAFVALGVVALALGGGSTSATTPVDPATETFVVEHVDTTSEVPRVVRAGLVGQTARSPR